MLGASKMTLDAREYRLTRESRSARKEENFVSPLARRVIQVSRNATALIFTNRNLK